MPASAQDWSSVETYSGYISTSTGRKPYQGVSPDYFIFAKCGQYGVLGYQENPPLCPGESEPWGGESFVPLSAFATSEGVAELGSYVVQLQQTQERGVALAASLASIAPPDGRSNRVAVGMGSYGDENALSLNYRHRPGDLDSPCLLPSQVMTS